VEDVHSNILDHVSDLHGRLSTAVRLAQTNLKVAQGRMKQWYDKRAQSRTFKPGDKVLILLPIHHLSLQARYCGPYVIEKKLSEVDYVCLHAGPLLTEKSLPRQHDQGVL